MNIGVALSTDAELNVAKTFLSNESKKTANVNVDQIKLLMPVKDAF